MANEEALVLDGLALNDGVTFGMVKFDAPVPRQRQDWIGAADSEAQLLVRNPLHENRKITVRLAVVTQASMNVAHDKLLLVLDKLQKASKYANGITMTWTPATGTRTSTFEVLSAEIVDLPIDWESGWLSYSPEFTIEMTCKPYWLGTPLATITDAFAANSIADYTFDAGAAGNVTITGGVVDAAANLTTENRFLHAASPYALANAQVTAKHTLGTTLSSYKAGVILKRVDASNYLEAYVDDTGAASRLRIDRIVAGARTNLVSSALTRLVVSTSYWVRGRIEGNIVVAEHWTSAPTVTGTATTANTTTLAGGDATALGTGVTGRAGLVWIPQQTAATLDDLEIAPNVFVSSTPFVTGEIVGVPGDVPALGAPLAITDTAAQSRRHIEWGLEGPLTYNASTSLLIDSDDMVTSGFAGTGSTFSGAYDPNAAGNSTIQALVVPAGVTFALAGLGNLSHIGSFRVKLRVNATLGTQFRLAWKAGDGPLSTNPWTEAPLEAQWVELDLGTVSIPTVLSGTQRWTGQIEANATLAGAGMQIDYLVLVPTTDGYGKARGSYSYTPGVVAGYDMFASTTAAAALNARVAPAGGTWATSGSATDLVFADSFSNEQIVRSTSSDAGPRFAVLGSTSYTDSQVEANVLRGGFPSSGNIEQGVIARWTDSSNYLRAVVWRDGTTIARNLTLVQRVAGTDTTLASVDLGTSSYIPNSYYCIRLVTYSSGRALVWFMDASKSTIYATLEASSTVLATAGTLASGKPGIYDYQPGSSGGGNNRYYDDFVTSTPAAEPIVVYSGRNMQVRYDDVIRQDSTGTYTGRPQSYRGGRFLLPVGTSRVLVKARRADIEAAADNNVTDATQIQVGWTPRGLAVPR